jgi:hypothetical protein
MPFLCTTTPHLLQQRSPKEFEQFRIQAKRFTLHLLRLRWLGHVMRMPGEHAAQQVLFGQLRGARPVGSPPVSLHGLMHRDVLLLNGGGGHVHGQRWYQKSALGRKHGGLVLVRCYEVFRSLHGLEIHWNGSQGSP